MPDYMRPATLDEALELRAARDVAVMAGGTDIYPAWTTRRAWGDPVHKDVLDISRIAGLLGIAREGGRWRIGALATWSDVIAADLPMLFDGLRMAAREVGGAQVQNRGTLAGNLCTGSPAGDGIPCLLALDAEIEVQSVRGQRRLPIAAFNTGYRATALEPDEIVTAILVPDKPARSAFVKLGARRYLVISIAMVSAVVTTDEAGRITQARVAVGACAPVARRLKALEQRLIAVQVAQARDCVIPDDLADLAPIDDIRASGAYRSDAALTLVRDCLGLLAAGTQERAA